MGKGTRQRVTHEVAFFGSQASGLNSEAIEKRDTQFSYNFYLQNGILKKIPGSSLYLHSSYGSSPIPWLAEFQRRAIWQLGQNLLIETAEGSQVEELLASDFDTDTIRSDTWQNQIYLANGKQLRSYNGSVVADLGLFPPGNGLVPRELFAVSNGTGGAGFTAAAVYRYTVTFYDTETDTESLPIGALPDESGLFQTAEYEEEDNPLGWLSQEVTVQAGGSTYLELAFDTQFRAWLQNVAPARANVFRIYRSKLTAGIPGDYKLLTGFPLTNGVFVVPFGGLPSVEGNSYLMSNLFTVQDVTFSDSDLFETLLPEEITPPPTRSSLVNSGAPAASTTGPKFVRFWRDSLFLFGTEFPTYTISDSFTGISDRNFASNSVLYGSDTFLPEYYPFNWGIGTGDGQAQTGLAVVNDILCIFKERSIYTLVGTSLSNFVPKIQDEVRGCIAPGSLQETPYGAIFLSSAGIARFKGTGTSEIISDKILDEIQDINRDALDVITSSYDPDQEIYTIYVPRGTATQNTRALMFSMKDAGWTVVERRRFISSATIIPKENGPPVSLIATASGGFLLDISSREVVSDYEDLRITSRYRSSDIDFGNSEQQKRATWLYVKARCSVNFFIDIAVYADDGQSGVYRQENINSESFISYYASSATDPDGAVYDTDLYMGPQTQKIIKIPVYGIGRDFFVEVTERSMNSVRHSFDLLSIKLEAVLLEQ